MSENIVLLVEDNPDDEELTLIALKRSRFVNQVIVAHDGVEALDIMFSTGPYANQDSTSMPDLILLDLKLPKLSGLEVLQRLRQDPRTQTIPIVVLTSSNEEGDIANSYRLGANSYVRKPIDFVQFTESIRLVGQYWLTVNEALPSK